MKEIEVYYANGSVLTFHVYDAQIDNDRLYLACPVPTGIAQIISISIKHMTHIYIDGRRAYKRWKGDI